MNQQVYQLPDIRGISKKGRQVFEMIDPGLREKYRGWLGGTDAGPEEQCSAETEMEADQKAREKHPG